ncbi:type IV secretion system DNA-binding domain-containing protein [Thiomonas intermedia]|uniref:type IV secretion system DNA-binding domain-containing protein n=1 Tax=Thiomonas intermedia TaxID=926 RepID=UPI0009A51299|nr:type IV secretion system DNA-binding domain-containing protein [Thiomonas intermedia]
MRDDQYQRPPWSPADGVFAAVFTAAFIYLAGWQLGAHVVAHYPASVAFKAGWQFLGAFPGHSGWPALGLTIGFASLIPAVILAALAGFFAARPNNPSGLRHIAGPQLIERTPKTNGEGIEPLKGWHWHIRDEVAHTLILGSSGGGKTVLVRKLVREHTRRGDKLLISDPKGDFVSELDQLIIFAPWDMRSGRWLVGHDINSELIAVEWAVNVIPTPKNGDPVWAQSAQSILIAALTEIRARRGKNWFLSDLRQTLLAQLSDPLIIQSVIREYLPEAAGLVVDIRGKTFASVLMNLSAALRPLLLLCKLDGALARIKAKPVSLANWAAAKSAPPLVLLHHQQAADMTKSFCAGVVDFLVSYYANQSDRKPDHRRVAFILDEYPQLGRVPSTIRALEILRSKGVRMVLGAQSPAQFIDTYSREQWQVVQDTTATKIITRIVGSDSADWAEKLAGIRVVERYQWSRGGAQISEQWVRAEEPIIRASRFKTDLSPDSKGVGIVIVPPGSRNVYMCRAQFDKIVQLRKPRRFWPHSILADADAGAPGGGAAMPAAPAQAVASPAMAAAVPTLAPEPAGPVVDPVDMTGWLLEMQREPEPDPAEATPAAEATDEAVAAAGAPAAEAALDFLAPGAGLLVQAADALEKVDMLASAAPAAAVAAPAAPVGAQAPRRRFKLRAAEAAAEATDPEEDEEQHED